MANSISQTAYLVAQYRALETKRRDALFHDPFAHVLAGGQGKLLMAAFGDDRQAVNAIAVRTRVMDEIIIDLVRAGKVSTVLNLGAGLDTRPYRLPLPPSLHWIEVDVPEILAEKKRLLNHQPTVCNLKQIGFDLADSSQTTVLFEQINANSERVLVITEGLLSYLSKEQVGRLAADLQQQPNFKWWLFELVSARLLQQGDRYWNQKLFTQYFGGDHATSLLFGPENGVAFFQAYGWQKAIFRSVWEEMYRLRRGTVVMGIIVFLMRRFAKAHWQKCRQQSGIVLMQQVPRAKF